MSMYSINILDRSRIEYIDEFENRLIINWEPEVLEGSNNKHNFFLYLKNIKQWNSTSKSDFLLSKDEKELLYQRLNIFFDQQHLSHSSDLE